MYNNYSRYLGAKRCCDLNNLINGAQGSQGPGNFNTAEDLSVQIDLF